MYTDSKPLDCKLLRTYTSNKHLRDISTKTNDELEWQQLVEPNTMLFTMIAFCSIMEQNYIVTVVWIPGIYNCIQFSSL